MESEFNGAGSPTISLPKGGGAVQGIGETFSPNLFSGTGNVNVPIYASPGREGFGPELNLTYSSGHGNGIFGMGWSLSIPRITRKTEKGLPRYDDSTEARDVFVMSGAEDLVPVLRTSNPDALWSDTVTDPTGNNPNQYTVTRYCPRTEGLFARIESWVRTDPVSSNKILEHFWRVTTKDNVTSIYGRTPEAQIAAPPETTENNTRIYEWLLQESFDDKGNHILYQYLGDSSQGQLSPIYEQGRSYHNRYPRRILYGNLSPQLRNYDSSQFVAGIAATATSNTNPFATLTRRYVFELLFDYEDLLTKQSGAISLAYPAHQSGLESLSAGSAIRPDPFSSFRAGFEVRTMRRCKRVLMFHYFKELAATSDKPVLVKSTDFSYQQSAHSGLSLLTSTRLSGYRQNSVGLYQSKSLPPLEFDYSDFAPQEQSYQSATSEEGRIPAHSLRDQNTSLVDLLGNGLQDLVQTSDAGFRYWRNLGGGNFDRPHPLHESPMGLTLEDTGVYFADRGGDGLTDLVVQTETVSGFFELEAEQVVNNRLEGGWSERSFTRTLAPSINPSAPNLKRLDLTGDGLTDLLLTTDSEFIWCQSLGEKGFAPPRHVAKQHGLERVFFDDPSGRVRLADMNGDGLSDIVLLHNGRIDYWPNLGYGRFGKQTTMSTESFRLPHNFDPQRLFLVDIDGSGTTDVVYIDFNSTHYWLNKSGNSLSTKQTIHGTPIAVDNTGISFADLYGTGTACLIWSYDFNSVKDGNYKFLDFCGQRKPYLLTSMVNNLGASTRIEYASSVQFYLQDIREKNFWFTPLPFPVQVVAKTVSIDSISNTKLVSKFKYHHGFYDGKEKEFRGFGRVDQIDTEHFDEFSHTDESTPSPSNAIRAHHSVPVETRTWFHTGVYYEEEDLLARYRGEYFSGVDHLDTSQRAVDSAAFDLGGNEVIVDQIGTLKEAHRALRGSILRTEIYAHDTTPERNFPYSVSESTYQVSTVQSNSNTLLTNRHAVFVTQVRDQISYHYERVHSGRNLVDPRIQHTVVLKTDDFNNVLKSASIAYKRRQSQYLEQSRDYITINRQGFCNPLNDLINHRHSVSFESEQFELTGISRGLNQQLTATYLNSIWNTAQSLRYEQQHTDGVLQKRRLSLNNILFWKDDLTSPLALGQSGTRALAYESYTLALTPTLRTKLFGTGVINSTLATRGGYRSKAGNLWVAPNQSNWWIPSGQQRFSPQNFYQSSSTIDPFGNAIEIHHDPYGLFPIRIEDALSNIQEGAIDYRVLQLFLTRDHNGNHAEAAFDILGMLVGAATMGKAGRAASASILGITASQVAQMRSNSEADSLEGFIADLPDALHDNLFADPDGTNNSPNSPSNVRSALKAASSRVVYDLFAFHLRGEATRSCTIAREEHHAANSASPLQISYKYSDGFGRVVQKKAQAEPLKSGVNKDKRRWSVSGWTTFNNKGSVVKKFEPRFSFITDFEPGIETGVSSVQFYDPLQRVICRLNPNNTFEKTVFTPWVQKFWDVNDTVLMDPRSDPNVTDVMSNYIGTLGNFQTWYEQRKTLPASPTHTDEAEKAAAEKASAHADTPTIRHVNPIGNIFLSLVNNKPKILETRLKTDIEGQDISILDPRNIKVFEHGFDMAGRKLHILSKDAGEKKMFPAVDSQPLHSWDARGHHVTTDYDELRRAIAVRLKKPSQPERLVEWLVYGESKTQPESTNSRGELWKHYDTAGLVEIESMDFKGNVLRTNRRLLLDATEAETDWPQASSAILDETTAVTLLEPLTRLGTSTYPIAAKFDALNRLIENTLPNGTVQKPGYNQASLLENLYVQLPGQTTEPFITNIDYNAKGQRKRIEYVNGVSTEYTYEQETFRLKQLFTNRNQSPKTLQKLSYYYDPIGNITSIRDDAHKIIFNQNQDIKPESTYTYDALYRLTEATGREHESMTACHYQTNGKKHTEFLPLPQSSANANALINYIENYQYDDAGNLTQTKHSALFRTGIQTRIRNQSYATQSNQILSSTASCNNEDQSLIHDANGNITKLAHLPDLKWDYKNQLIEAQLNIGTTPNRAFYQYDNIGQRVRKTVSKNNGADVSERIYLGNFEIYTELTSSGIKRQRESIHVTDEKDRIALVETETNLQTPSALPTIVKRFQLSNHLGSATQELDETGRQISYEEYYPYGGSAYQAGRNQAQVSLKRYRYSGKERDDETGLYYYGARYYAPWLGRWLSCDPIGFKDGPNLYRFVKNNPILFSDPHGTESNKFSKKGENILGPYKGEGAVDGHHVHQASAYTEVAGDRKSHPMYKDALSVSQKEGAFSEPTKPGNTNSEPHKKANRVQNKTDSARRGKTFSYEFKSPDTPDIKIESSGNGLLKSVPNQDVEDIKAYHALMAGGVDPDDSLEAVQKSRVQLESKGVTPTRVPGENGPAQKLSTTSKFSEVGERLAKAAPKFAKAGKFVVAAVPFLGAGSAQASAAHNLSEGRPGEALMDEAGLVPVAGDILDASRGVIAVKEGIDEIVGTADVSFRHGESAMESAEELGMSEDSARIVGGVASAVSSLTVAPYIGIYETVKSVF